MIRKFIALILVLITTLSVPGFTLFVHYCNGKAETFSLISNIDPCKDATSKTCCVAKQTPKKNKSCCKSDKTTDEQCSIQESDCCESQIIKHKGTKIISYRPDLKLQNCGSDLILNYSKDIKNLFVDNSINYSYLSNAPPPLPSGKEICVRVCSFLI